MNKSRLERGTKKLKAMSQIEKAKKKIAWSKPRIVARSKPKNLLLDKFEYGIGGGK